MTSLLARYIVAVIAANLWMLSSARKLPDSDFVSHERRLYSDLLQNYEKAIRPVNRTTDTLAVKMDLALINVDLLDEGAQTLTTSVYLRLFWNDFQLTWDEKKYDNINSIRIPSSSLWTPDLTVYNSAGDPLPLTSHLSLVSSNGDVLNVSPLTLNTHCVTETKYFPYDKPVCTIKIGSWTYSGNQIDLQFFDGANSSFVEIDMTHYVRAGPVEVVEGTGVINQVKYSCCPEHYPDITYSLTFQRLSTFATHLFLAPSVTLSLIIPTIFILPVGSTERTTLGIGVLIANTLLLGELMQYVPTGNQPNLPIMSQFFLANIVLVTLSLVVSTVVINLSSRDSKNSTGPGTVVRLVFLNAVMTKLLCVQPNESDNANNKSSGSGPEEVATSDSIQLNDDRIQIIRNLERGQIAGEWRAVAAVIDRLFLIAFFVVIAVLCLCFLQYL